MPRNESILEHALRRAELAQVKEHADHILGGDDEYRVEYLLTTAAECRRRELPLREHLLLIKAADTEFAPIRSYIQDALRIYGEMAGDEYPE